MDGDFFVGAALATTLTKLAMRYVAQTLDKRKQNVRFYLDMLPNVLTAQFPCCDFILYILQIGS